MRTAVGLDGDRCMRDTQTVVTVQRQRQEGHGDANGGDRRVVEFWNAERY